MLTLTSGVVLLLLAGVFCVLSAVALVRAISGVREDRFGAVSWFDPRAWSLVVMPLLIGVGIGGLLRLTALSAGLRIGLGVLIGGGLLALAATFALRSRIVVSTVGLETPKQFLRWIMVDDYAETPTGLVLFYRQGLQRHRFDLAVPRRHRARVAQITGACLDARFEYAARIYAGHQTLGSVE